MYRTVTEEELQEERRAAGLMSDAENIAEAIRTLKTLRAELASGADTPWRMLYHATEYLEGQLRILLGPDPE